MSSNDDEDGQTPKPDYEVGYGRPPKDRQFKPGESGNPKGRKHKPKSVRTQTETILSRKVTVTEGGRAMKLSVQEVILRAQVQKAVKGDLKSAAFLLRLRTAPEFADTDIIDPTGLSSDDQAMLDDMMRQFAGPDGPEGTEPPDRSAMGDDTPADESAEGEPSVQTQIPQTGLEPGNPADKEN